MSDTSFLDWPFFDDRHRALAADMGYNHPVGPLKLTDIVGLDVRLAVADHLHASLADATYAAPNILRQMVAAGHLGKKTGRGFYPWPGKR